MSNRERGGLQPRMNLELGKDVLDVRPNGIGREPELRGDTVAGEPTSEERENLELPSVSPSICASSSER